MSKCELTDRKTGMSYYSCIHSFQVEYMIKAYAINPEKQRQKALKESE